MNIPPLPAPEPYSPPVCDDMGQSIGQLRARLAVRLEIAGQDDPESVAFARNVAEAARLERMIRRREQNS